MTNLRPPTKKEMDHEFMRIDNARSQDALRQRLNSMKNPQKLYAFMLALENENFHTLGNEVRVQLKGLGWDGTYPLTGEGYTTAA